MLRWIGQTFGTIAINSTFQYAALNQFEYRGEELINCTVEKYTTLGVIGPPISWPRYEWNHTCEFLYRQVHSFNEVKQQTYLLCIRTSPFWYSELYS